MSQLRIASINIERSRHLHRVEAFLQTCKPDVLCLQELCAIDIPFFEDLIGNTLTFAPMMIHPTENGPQTVGVGMVAWGALEDITTTYYHGSREGVQTIQFLNVKDQKLPETDTIADALIAATYQGFRIATTHLNVTHHGESTPWQLATAAKLITAAQHEASQHGGLLLTGDFNAPRGRPTFSLLAEAFTDGVPAHYTTSIDGTLHRAGQLPYMVDGLFHTPNYHLKNPTLHTGVSDHCALTCTLSKA